MSTLPTLRLEQIALVVDNAPVGEQFSIQQLLNDIKQNSGNVADIIVIAERWDILEKYLVHDLGLFEITRSTQQANLYILTFCGLRARNIGFIKYRKELDEKVFEEKNEHRLQRAKLQLEVDQFSKLVKDYSRTKRKVNLGLLLAIAAALGTILQAIWPLLK